jgi:hypothetical protein
MTLEIIFFPNKEDTCNINGSDIIFRTDLGTQINGFINISVILRTMDAEQ